MIIKQTNEVSPSALALIASQAFQLYCGEMGRAPAPMTADYAHHLQEDVVFTVEEGDLLIGFAIIMQKTDGFWLETIAILPDYSGMGIGTKLMHAIEHYLRARTSSYQLYTNEVMRAAQSWYKRLGFNETDRRLGDGFQRIYYQKKL